jgi:hypothetical protein
VPGGSPMNSDNFGILRQALIIRDVLCLAAREVMNRTGAVVADVIDKKLKSMKLHYPWLSENRLLNLQQA